jgi:hypothetical protein
MKEPGISRAFECPRRNEPSTFGYFRRVPRQPVDLAYVSRFQPRGKDGIRELSEVGDPLRARPDRVSREFELEPRRRCYLVVTCMLFLNLVGSGAAAPIAAGRRPNPSVRRIALAAAREPL